MVRLDFSNVDFGSQLDEDHMFLWGSEIPGFVRWDQDTLVLRSKRISKATLRNLLALLWRYQVPMQQLIQFENERNTGWLRSPKSYWYARVFEEKA